METHSSQNVPEKKKRAPKKKADKVAEPVPTPIKEIPNIQYTLEDANEDDAPSTKKRGRKPRGGKLIMKHSENVEENNSVTNIILHLKCSLSDLTDYQTRISKLVTDPMEYNPNIPTEILTYNENENIFVFNNQSIYPTPYSSNGNEEEENNTPFTTNQTNSNGSIIAPTHTALSPSTQLCSQCMNICDKNVIMEDVQVIEDPEVENVNVKEMNVKIKRLKVMLYKNSLPADKKSACFWDTCEFDNTPCHIPLYEEGGVFHGYGSFCRPECAVAYLFKENLDDSTKFERYNMINRAYGKAYDCKKNIKPAPNPFYLLDKFYGNLSIQEYRKLLKTQHLLLVLDKPFTRILPELHEDNDELIMNIYGMNKQNNNVSGVYKVKRQSEKQQGPSKASIMKNKFFPAE